MLEAAPRSMISAITISRRRLSELNNDVQLRSSAVNQDAKKIKSEINNLTNDLDVLQKKSKELKSKLDSIKIELNKKLNLKLKELNFKATQSIDYYFLNELANRIAEAYPSNPIEKFLRIVEQIQLVILKTILASVRIPFLEGLEIIPESLAQLFKYEVVLRNKNELEFRSKREAEDFAERLVVEAKQIVETLLSQKLSEIEIEIIAHNRELHQALRENTAEVIQKARRRLNQDFTVHLDLPALLSEEIEPSLEISSNNTINKNKNFDILKAIVNFFRGFFDKNYTEDNEYTYIVSLPKTVENFNQSTKKKIYEIEAQINQHLEQNFEDRIDEFVADLEDYLKSYQKNLEQALKDQDLSLSQQESNRKIFIALAEDVKKLNKELEKKQYEVNKLSSKK